MAFIDRIREELDRAGRQASRALDEGRLRLELFRARQSADRFAQRFGYAVFRAKQSGNELPPDEMTAHMNNLTAAEAEVTRLQTLIQESANDRKSAAADAPPRNEGPEEPPSASEKASDGTQPSGQDSVDR